MTIENLTLLPFLIIFLVVYLLWLIRKEKRFFEFIKDHWFFRRNFSHKISSFFYILGFIGIVLSLMDLRGPEELIKSKTSGQKTILLIDTSASMLAEDVRPSRFKKAILLARHYIKNAIGQQISIIVFSDGQKRIIPFTGDTDLLDARLQALDSMNLDRGGTGLSLAISEAMQYFRVTDEEMMGNILIFTDAEETEGGIDIKIPDTISVGVVAIGTARGSTIPVRDRNGNLRGNKKHKGETVITKLDETFLKKLAEEISSFKYWVASSYSLPTGEILDFFNRMYKLKTSQGQFRVKPVLTHYLLIPSLALMAFAMLLRMRNPFVALIALTILSGTGKQIAMAQETQKEGPQKTQEIIRLENKFASGEISQSEKLHLAEEYYKNGFVNEATTLYSETLPEEVNEDNFNSQMNYMTSLFKSQNLNEGIERARVLKKFAKNNSMTSKEEEIKKNLLKAIDSSESQSGQKNEDNQKNDKQNKSGQSGSNNQNDQNNDKQDGQSGQNNQQKNNEQQNNKNNENKNQDNKNNPEEKKNDQGQDKNNDNNEKKEQERSENKQEGQAGNKPKEVPSLLKQLVNDDNKLQKQLIDAQTQKRGDRDKKDW